MHVTKEDEYTQSRQWWSIRGLGERGFAAVIRVSGSSQLGNCSGLWVLGRLVRAVSEIAFQRNRNWAKVVEGRKEAEKRDSWHVRERVKLLYYIINEWMYCIVHVLPSILMGRAWEITCWDIILSSRRVFCEKTADYFMNRQTVW